MEQHRENKQHIGFFGKCNVGKSTIINTLIGQDISIVSSISGTTTDIVKKTMELKDVGAVVLIDTAGVDDMSELGKQRIKKTMEVFSLIDMAVIIVSNNNFDEKEKDLISECQRFNIPFLIIYNKNDIYPINDKTRQEIKQVFNQNILIVSHKDNNIKENITKELCRYLNNNQYNNDNVLNGIVKKDDVVVLVTPIDSSAPKGRMILPQVKMIREVLDNDAINIVTKETELVSTLKSLKENPYLVITDSQAFNYVNQIVDKNILLTSFSVLLAKEKGNFDLFLKGTPFIDKLKDGDLVLMLESCTHQPTCEDIGRVKLPLWLKKYTNKDLRFKAIAGLTNIEDDIDKVKMVIQCGGCMATKQQLQNRLLPFVEKQIPVSNYGLSIAYINGIFNRVTEIFRK